MSGRREADSSPRRTPGFRVLLFVVRFGVCRRLMVIGRVLPRRASDFLVATRQSPKKRPLPHRRLRRFPRFGRVRRVASKLALRAQTATRQFPPATACTRRCRRGRGGAGSASPLLVACCGFVARRLLSGRVSVRGFVAPANAGGQCFACRCSVRQASSIGGDWPDRVETRPAGSNSDATIPTGRGLR